METQTTNRSLRKGEMRGLLISQMKCELPEFRFLTYSTGVYYFQRRRDFGDYDVREIFHIVQSSDDQAMTCSVSSRLNPLYTLHPGYDDGLINPHADILTLKKSMCDEATEGYRHNGELFSAMDMVTAIVNDLRVYGITFLETKWSLLNSHRLIRFGLHVIDGWDHDKIMLKNDLEKQMIKAKGSWTRLHHPVYNSLMKQLSEVLSDGEGDRAKVPKLAFDLLELYCLRKIGS